VFQEREKKKLEYENQINRISNQLEYEKKREEQLKQNVEKFERTVQVRSFGCTLFPVQSYQFGDRC
jgi:predicted RNase H-like nuclease (RuvC/YqgF family)